MISPYLCQINWWSASLQNFFKGQVTVPNWMKFRKFSKWPSTPTPHPSEILSQNGLHLWKSCACISYYLALEPPCIFWTISIVKSCNIIFRKWGGFKGCLEIFRKFIWFRGRTLSLLPYCSVSKYRVSQKKVYFKMMMMISLILRVLDEKNND